MPLFGRHSNEVAHHEPPVDERRRSGGGFFGGRRSSEVAHHPAEDRHHRSGGGFFGGRRSSEVAHPPVEERRRSGGLFNRHSNEVTAPPVQEHRRSNGLFGRHRSISPPATTAANTKTRRHSSLSSHSSHSRSPKRGLMGRRAEDPSIMSARERVLSAESAEKEADRALLQAKAAVRDARDHVKRLEHEAAEEARLAKLKQTQAKSISKRARPLGRHEHHVI